MRERQRSIIVLAAVSVTFCSCSTKRGDKPRDARPDETREIPLSSIVSTRGQFGRQQSTSGYLAQIYEKMSGPSNVFLADAPDIDGAVSAAFGAMVGFRSADTPVTLDQSNPPRGNYWLVTYLGTSTSTGPWFIVDKITVDRSKIRFSYHTPKLSTVTADLVPYLYWVPIGNLADGTYDLELHDSKNDLVTLVRRIVVGTSTETGH